MNLDDKNFSGLLKLSSCKIYLNKNQDLKSAIPGQIL